MPTVKETESQIAHVFIRCTPALKQKVEEAAKIDSRSVNSFGVVALQKEAGRILAENGRK